MPRPALNDDLVLILLFLFVGAILVSVWPSYVLLIFGLMIVLAFLWLMWIVRSAKP